MRIQTLFEFLGGDAFLWYLLISHLSALRLHMYLQSSGDHGDMEMEKWKHGGIDIETWKQRATETWRHRNMET